VIGDRAIKFGQKLPIDTKVMETVICDKCEAEFSLVHYQPNADTERAKRQAKRVRSLLIGEHVDPKHAQHLDSYDDLDDD
jgi:hypothetical protein